MYKNKFNTLIAVLVALAITTLACSAGGVSVGWTPTSTPNAAAPTPAASPTLAPTAGGPLATIGAPNAYESPTPAPAVPLTATPGTTTGVTANCPKLDEARAAFGVDVTLIGTESCAYTWNSGDGSFKTVNRASGWIINSAEVDGLIYVRSGNGNTVQAKAATWRKMTENPGLTLELQFTLLTGFAALPQNAFASLVRCPECSGFPPAVPAGAAPTCPAVAGFTNSNITGGCLYKSSTPASFVIPAGWKALSGTPATWAMSGTLPGITQVSLYKQ